MKRTLASVLIALLAGLAAAEARAQAAAPASERITVPVLADRVRAGEVLGPEHFTEAELILARVPADAVLHPEDAYGLAPRRTLVSGQALSAALLKAPDLVRKNEAVTMVFRKDGLSMSAQGRALDNGAEGALVRVMNLHSKRVIDGVVAGSGLIEVGPAGPATF